MTSRSQEDLELERTLQSLEAPEPSAALRRAVAEIPLRHPRSEHGHYPWPVLRSTWALAACAVLAVSLGAASGTWLNELDLALEAEQVEQSYDEELSDAAELAFAVDLDQELEP